MRRYTPGEFYDASPMPNLNSEEIDFQVASELISEYRKLSVGDMDILRLRLPIKVARFQLLVA